MCYVPMLRTPSHTRHRDYIHGMYVRMRRQAAQIGSGPGGVLLNKSLIATSRLIDVTPLNSSRNLRIFQCSFLGIGLHSESLRAFCNEHYPRMKDIPRRSRVHTVLVDGAHLSANLIINCSATAPRTTTAFWDCGIRCS